MASPAGTIARGLRGKSRSLTVAAKDLGSIDVFRSKLAKGSSSSPLREFFGIPEPSRSENSLIISKFIKLFNLRSPGVKKDRIWEENLQTLLRGKDRIGFAEITKILSPEFSQACLKVKDIDADARNHVYLSDNTKGKTSQKKLKTSNK